MSELTLVKDKRNPNLHTIEFRGGDGGGKRPSVLDGLWSSKYGNKAIKAYLERPRPKPIEYKHQMNISKEEEADLFAEVQRETARINEELEANSNGKEESKKNKSKARKQSVRKGTDNRSLSSNVS